MTRRLVPFVIMAALVTVLVVAGVFITLGLWMRSEQPSSPLAAVVSRAESSLSRLPRLPGSLATLRGVVDAVQRAVEAKLDIRFETESRESPRTSCADYVLDATRAEVGVDAVRRADVLVTEAQWFAAVSAAERALGPRAVRAPGSQEYFDEYRLPDVGTITMTRTTAGAVLFRSLGEQGVGSSDSTLVWLLLGYLLSQEPRSPSASDVTAVESSLAAKPSLPKALAVVRRTVDEAQAALEAALGVSFAAVHPPSRSALASCPGDLAGATRARVAVDAERRAGITLTDAQWRTAVSAVARALELRVENDRGPYVLPRGVHRRQRQRGPVDENRRLHTRREARGDDRMPVAVSESGCSGTGPV